MTKQSNRLANETSPYLLQHQHNPVDWYAWGDEAFERARRENKPIFLSVGYSTCYWCHVMERQSFENEMVAKEMNERFVCIKVDREERPDVDQLYMMAVQVLTRHGGWPMSVWLTPDLRPFFGGTYFPPTDTQGRPGFVSVLRGLEDAYKNRHEDVEKTADQLVDILSQMAEPLGAEREIRVDDAFVDELVARSVSDYEPQFGGFGNAPKFPRETLIEMLLMYCAKPRSGGEKTQERVMKMIRHALDAMASGGIRDQLGGGFHRYSTDAKWLVPHFEIMLYDNAMLAWCYAEAFRQTNEQRYAQVAREVCDFILREMTSPEGAFYTALDAEVDGREGLNYLWTAEQIEEVLGAENAKIFNRVYGVDHGPNFEDPHHGAGMPDANVLYEAHVVDDPKIDAMRKKLKAARMQRKRPLLDTKIITSWNALMIRALAHAGSVLQEKKYLDAAEKVADFLVSKHRMPDGGLYRTSRDGAAKYAGFLDDYAFLSWALVSLNRMEDAREVTAKMRERFGDDAGGFYFTDRDAKDLIVRQKTASDSPLPSGNAIAAMALLALDENDAARKTIEVFAPQLQQQGEGMSSMVQAAMMYVERHGAFDVAARPASNRPMSPDQLAAGVVTVSGEFVNETQLNLKLDIANGYHINGHEAAEGMIATQVNVDAEADVKYPPGERYESSVAIELHFKQPITQNLRVNVTYQACDESACLPPVTKRLDVRAT